MDISLHQDPCKRTKLKTDDTENACALSCPGRENFKRFGGKRLHVRSQT